MESARCSEILFECQGIAKLAALTQLSLTSRFQYSYLNIGQDYLLTNLDI